MINEELVETARLLVATVQESENLSPDLLRGLILRIVPTLISEIEILGNVAQTALSALPSDEPEIVIDLPFVSVEPDEEPVPQKKASKPKKKKGRKGRK